MNTLTVKKTAITSVIIMSLLSTPLMAKETMMSSAVQTHEEKSKNENIGFGTGALVGAIVAGPLGAIVAGVTGIFIAKHINATDDVEVLSTELASAQDHMKKNQDEIAQYKMQLAGALQNYQQDIESVKTQYQLANDSGLNEQLSLENLLMSLQFSTGSSEISAHYQEQVSAVAQVLNDTPHLSITLSGYTDLAGEADHNQQLSLARVESVRSLLMAQGVNEDQITMQAYGETAPVAATTEQEVNFYDRRVVLKLHSSLNHMAKR
ncbi:OmpA family protein [Colwellia asteriadis]|uniref:OmpA family protein n=1 Tax=Colwellia asteriadis TaxID=517723 RepID=A0ABP3WKV0_9GAMM